MTPKQSSACPAHSEASIGQAQFILPLVIAGVLTTPSLSQKMAHARKLPEPGAHYATSSSADVYLDSESPAFIGFGYHFDIDTNTWTRKQPVAIISMTSEPSLLEERIEAQEFLSQSESYSRSQASIDISAALGLFELGATFEYSQAGSSSSAYSSFSLALRREYDFLISDILQAELTPTAIAILDQISQGADPQIWTDAFGEFIAVGTLPTAGAEFRLNFASDASWAARSSYFDVRATFATASGMASLASYAETSILTENLNLDFRAVGVDLPSNVTVPTREEIKGGVSFLGWLNDELRPALIAAPPANVGLLVMPMAAFPGAPLNLDQPQFNVGLLAAIGEEVRNSLDVLLVANRWRAPAAMRDFIDMATAGKGTELQAARLALLDALDVLAMSARDYAKGMKSQDELETAANDCQSKREAAEVIIQAILEAVTQLAPPDYNEHADGWTEIGTGDTPPINQIVAKFTLEAIAVFPSTPYLSSYAEATRPLIQIGEINDDTCQGENIERIVDQSRILDFDVLNVKQNPITPGLVDIDLRIRWVLTDTFNYGCRAELIVQDELFRVLHEEDLIINH